MKRVNVAIVSISNAVNHCNYWGTLAMCCAPDFLLHAETRIRPGPEVGHSRGHYTLAMRDGDESPVMDVISFKREHCVY
jgi:hypothetical protein